MESVPTEIVDLIIKSSDIDAKFALLLTGKGLHSSTIRYLKPVIQYYNNGRIQSKIWIDGNIKREIRYTNDIQNKKYRETWYRDGKIHRDDKPADIRYWNNGNKSEENWYQDGNMHRENAPAQRGWYENGNKYYESWHYNGKQHRENGPAEILWDENGNVFKKEWWINDVRQYHRQ